MESIFSRGLRHVFSWKWEGCKDSVFLLQASAIAMLQRPFVFKDIVLAKDLVVLERARCPTNLDKTSESLLQNTIQAVWRSVGARSRLPYACLNQRVMRGTFRAPTVFYARLACSDILAHRAVHICFRLSADMSSLLRSIFLLLGRSQHCK